jgi:hypothetical protein
VASILRIPTAKPSSTGLATKGGYQLLPTSLATQGAQLLPTSLAKQGAQLISPNVAGQLASSQYDQAIADAQAALQQQESDNAQSLANVNNWYGQVLGAQNNAAAHDSALSQAVQGSEQGSNAAVLASLGGGANAAGGAVAAAGQNNLGTLSALGHIEDQYNADIVPLLKLGQAGAASTQQAANSRLLAGATQNISDLLGQKGATEAQYSYDILNKNNDIRNQQADRLTSIMQGNNDTRTNRANLLASIVGANNNTVSQIKSDKNAAATLGLNRRQLSDQETQNTLATILATSYDPATGSITKEGQNLISKLVGVPASAVGGTDAGHAASIVTAGIRAGAPKIVGSSSTGYYEVNPATGAKVQLIKPGAKSASPKVVGSTGGGYWLVDPSNPKHPTQIVAPHSSATAHTATPEQITNQIAEWRHGKTETVHNGDGSVTTQKAGALTYQQAYQALRTVYRMPDKAARSALDTQYGRGEGGDPQGHGARAWLTNEEQTALKKAGRQAYVGYYQGHAYIAQAQMKTLQAAGHLPPGELVNGRYFIQPSAHVPVQSAGS